MSHHLRTLYIVPTNPELFLVEKMPSVCPGGDYSGKREEQEVNKPVAVQNYTTAQTCKCPGSPGEARLSPTEGTCSGRAQEK